MNDPTCQIVVQKLESLHRAGVRQLGRWPKVQTSGESGTREKGRDGGKQEFELSILAKEVSRCTACSQLAAKRTQTVFGVGNPRAQLCFLGEAPGADEDRLGEPFVGRAGQLLNDIIKACKLRREDVYILNVIKCRPPGNRTPAPEEVANCRCFFERQLEIIHPQFICCLGSVAASSLLGVHQPLGRLRGRIHHWRDIQVVVTYHPAYLLRYPSKKREAWNDLQMLIKAMGCTLPSPTAVRVHSGHNPRLDRPKQV